MNAFVRANSINAVVKCRKREIFPINQSPKLCHILVGKMKAVVVAVSTSYGIFGIQILQLHELVKCVRNCVFPLCNKHTQTSIHSCAMCDV